MHGPEPAGRALARSAPAVSAVAAELERAMHLLDAGEDDALVARRLERLKRSPIAAVAAAALRRGERSRAMGLLWRAVLQW